MDKSGNVIKFDKGKGRSTPPSLEELVKMTHELVQKSENIHFDAPHAQQRMLERNITIRQVIETLRSGKGISGPTQDPYGDWRIKLCRLVAGRRVQIVVAVKDQYVDVITVM